jgi:hypothetical protein
LGNFGFSLAEIYRKIWIFFAENQMEIYKDRFMFGRRIKHVLNDKNNRLSRATANTVVPAKELKFRLPVYFWST